MSTELKAQTVTGQQAVQNGLSQPFDFLDTLREAHRPLDEGTQTQRDFRRQVRANLTTHFYDKLPHSLAVNCYFQASEPALRNAWADCLRELTDFGPEVAPTDDEQQTLIAQCNFVSQPDDFGQSLSLVRDYIAAGFIVVDRALAGDLQLEEERMSDAGQLPLASAIYWDNAWMTRALLESGASHDAGQVFLGGKRRDAHELAVAHGASECAAVIIAFRMREHLAKLSAAAPASAAPLRPAPARRRMGV
jgi:hypothetical protein